MNFDVRKQRGQTQALFLIETLENTNKYERVYDIMGSTGNVYRVAIKQKPTCTCPDYKKRESNCKHIYFVLLRIMKVNKQNEDKSIFSKLELLDMFNNIPMITNHLIVNNTLKQKYDNMKGKDPKDNKVTGKGTDDLCPICLDELENGDQLDYCKYSCGKYIHTVCFGMWCKNKIPVCVFCKQNWNKEIGQYVNLC